MALGELEQCGFIDVYNEASARQRKKGCYYTLSDPFILFYIRYMKNKRMKDEHWWGRSRARLNLNVFWIRILSYFRIQLYFRSSRRLNVAILSLSFNSFLSGSSWWSPITVNSTFGNRNWTLAPKTRILGKIVRFRKLRIMVVFGRRNRGYNDCRIRYLNPGVSKGSDCFRKK